MNEHVLIAGGGVAARQRSRTASTAASTVVGASTESAGDVQAWSGRAGRLAGRSSTMTPRRPESSRGRVPGATVPPSR